MHGPDALRLLGGEDSHHQRVNGHQTGRSNLAADQADSSDARSEVATRRLLNDNAVNLMHDGGLIDVMETVAFLRLAREEAPDFIVSLHSRSVIRRSTHRLRALDGQRTIEHSAIVCKNVTPRPDCPTPGRAQARRGRRRFRRLPSIWPAHCTTPAVA